MAEARFKYMWTLLKESDSVNLDGLTADMKCAICARILINATFASCGCRYCLQCVKAHLNEGNRFCPGKMDDCQLEALDIERNMFPDHPMNHRVSRLVVECRFSCGCRCELRSMEQHEKECGNRPVKCPYVDVGCTETQLVGNRINDHLVGENGSHAKLLLAFIDLLRSEVSCLKRESGEMRSDTAEMRSAREIDEERARETSEKMDQIEREVANLRNKNKLIREENSSLKAEIERHRARVEIQDKCSLFEEKLGEFERQTPKEKEELRENIDAVRQQLMSGQGVLEKRVREMGATVEMQHRGGFIWRIDGWAAKSQSARESGCTEIFSDAFYSHENGYRMCLSAWPDGYDARKGKYLSIGFHLMRGPFDNILPWPFKRDVTLSLIDQRTGNDHVNHTITFDGFPDHIHWNKPKTERNGAFGAWEFLDLSDLLNIVGLYEGDTIFIKCVVDERKYRGGVLGAPINNMPAVPQQSLNYNVPAVPQNFLGYYQAATYHHNSDVFGVRRF